MIITKLIDKEVDREREERKKRPTDKQIPNICYFTKARRRHVTILCFSLSAVSTKSKPSPALSAYVITATGKALSSLNNVLFLQTNINKFSSMVTDFSILVKWCDNDGLSMGEGSRSGRVMIYFERPVIFQ